MVMGLKHQGQSRWRSRISLVHKAHKGWCPHGTSAIQYVHYDALPRFRSSRQLLHPLVLKHQRHWYCHRDSGLLSLLQPNLLNLTGCQDSNRCCRCTPKLCCSHSSSHEPQSCCQTRRWSPIRKFIPGLPFPGRLGFPDFFIPVFPRMKTSRFPGNGNSRRHEHCSKLATTAVLHRSVRSLEPVVNTGHAWLAGNGKR